METADSSEETSAGPHKSLLSFLRVTAGSLGLKAAEVEQVCTLLCPPLPEKLKPLPVLWFSRGASQQPWLGCKSWQEPLLGPAHCLSSGLDGKRTLAALQPVASHCLGPR